MSPRSVYDIEFWYVINTQHKHIIYRSKSAQKAQLYASKKNLSVSKDNPELASYQVISGLELLSSDITTVGKISKAG